MRLEAEGLVEKAALQGSKKAGYQASERLINICYLMRYASRRVRQRLGWLIEFMRLWYSSDEMSDLARLRAGHHAGGLTSEPFGRVGEAPISDEQALYRLAEAVAAGDEAAFADLHEQVCECHVSGLGPTLRDLLIASPWADLLEPFALALGAAAATDPAQALAGAPAEVRAVAEEVLASLVRRHTRTWSVVGGQPLA